MGLISLTWVFATNIQSPQMDNLLRLSHFYNLLFQVKEDIRTGIFLFHFKTTQCENHFDINLIKSIQQ